MEYIELNIFSKDESKCTSFQREIEYHKNLSKKLEYFFIFRAENRNQHLPLLI